MMMKRGLDQKIIAGALMGLCLWLASAQSLRLNRAQQLCFPIFAPECSAPVAELRIAHLRTDYERCGVFKLALLPVAIADGVTLAVHNAESTRKALSTIHELPVAAERRVIFHAFELRLPAQSQAVLTAAVARPDQGGWRLSGVNFTTTTGTVQLPEATLLLTGANAGQFSYSTNTLNLFLDKL